MEPETTWYSYVSLTYTSLNKIPFANKSPALTFPKNQKSLLCLWAMGGEKEQEEEQ